MSDAMTVRKVEELSDADRRRLAVDLFNLTWTYIEKPKRTPRDDDAMLEAAYASAYFWSLIGKPENFARSQWQLSRVNAILKRVEPALYHARRCLDYCEEADLWGWDRPFAYEALARAHSVAGDFPQAEANLAAARTLGERIENEGDRKLLFSDLETIARQPVEKLATGS